MIDSRLHIGTVLLAGFLIIGGCSSNKQDYRDSGSAEKLKIGTDVSGRPHSRSDEANSADTSSITNPKFPEKDLLGVWTVDPNGPHADFELNKDYYFSVDQENNAQQRYLIDGDSIIVFFEGFTARGQITKARNDTLIVAWDNQDPTVYFRWNE